MQTKCPAFDAFSILGKKWTVVVLQEIDVNGRRGFNFLLHRLRNISPRVLTMRLRELESMGLVDKTVLRGKTLKTSYTLTKSGRELLGIIRLVKNMNSRRNGMSCNRKLCADCPIY